MLVIRLSQLSSQYLVSFKICKIEPIVIYFVPLCLDTENMISVSQRHEGMLSCLKVALSGILSSAIVDNFLENITQL